MKNTAAVFLTSLAVSAISLTVPMPAATTVLNLFIGEDIAVQTMIPPNHETPQRSTIEKDGEKCRHEHNNASDWESIEQLRKLPEQANVI